MGKSQKIIGNVAQLTGRTRLHQTSEHFGDAPGVRHTAARRKRGFGVEDFTDGTDARLFPDVLVEAMQKFIGFFKMIRTYFEPRVDERTDQPAPDRSLVVGGIPPTPV